MKTYVDTDGVIHSEKELIDKTYKIVEKINFKKKENEKGKYTTSTTIIITITGEQLNLFTEQK